MEFTFEETPWEKTLKKLSRGDTVSALDFLALTEELDEETAEEALQDLEQMGVTLSVEQLPAIGAVGAGAVRLKQEAAFTQVNDIFSLEENDPLRLYLEELAALPAAGDVALLAEDLLQGRDVSSQLAALCLSRVVEQSMTMTGRGVLLMDLIQEGSLGLWQGIAAYAGGDFEAHCDWWIRQYMAKAVTMHFRSSGLSQRLRQGMEDYLDVDARLLTELGRNPTIEEIAQAMHMDVQEAEMISETLRNARNLERAHGKPEQEETPAEEQQAVEDTAYFQSRQRILDMLSGLTEQEAALLSLRFGLEGGIPLDPEQTGARLGLTAQQVVAMEAAALKKLRNSETEKEG